MTRVAAITLFPLVIAVALMGLVFSASMHIEAPYVREVANQYAGDDGNKALSTYYSPKIGTVLFLVKTGAGRSGGLVIRATEMQGAKVVPLAEKTYETTCFSCDNSYWHRVIYRDGYIEMARVSASMLAAGIVGFFVAMGCVSTYLAKRGYGALGDRLTEEVKEGSRWNK